MQKDLISFSDVLIVCGQGTYKNGNYYTEYPDRDVYLRHAISVAKIVKEFKYTHVVCSGGFTQKSTPELSEAESFYAMWDDTDSWPMDHDRIFPDKLSLDSAENVYLGLMAARMKLYEKIPIRRISVFAAWKFKKARFNRLAKELGIIERFYFHGLAWANEADAGERALQGENNQMKKIIDANDSLLLSREWEGKRRVRYQGPGDENSLPTYDTRLNERQNQFPQFFGVLNEIRRYGMQDVLRKQLQKAFEKEVLNPGSGNGVAE